MALDLTKMRVYVNSGTLLPDDVIEAQWPDVEPDRSLDASELIEQIPNGRIADCIVGPIPIKRGISGRLGVGDRQARRLIRRLVPTVWRDLPFTLSGSLDAACITYSAEVIDGRRRRADLPPKLGSKPRGRPRMDG
jgi:hypothetical protein